MDCRNCTNNNNVRGAWEPRSTFPAALPGQLAPGQAWERREPVRGPSIDDALVPALRAMIGGMLVAVLMAALWAMGYIPWKLALLAGPLVAVVTFFLHDLTGRDALWKVETLTGVDFDGDGKTGPPKTVRLDITDKTPGRGPGMRFLDLDLTEDQARALAGLALRDSLNTRAAADLGISRVPFTKARDVLLDSGLVAWRVPGVPNDGVTATETGRRVFAELAG